MQITTFGAMNISPSILRALASGVSAGSLIKTGVVDKINFTININI